MIKIKKAKDIRNLFRLKKENKEIRNRVIRDLRSLVDHEKKYYYKTLRVGNLWRNNYIEYKSHGNRNKTLSVEEYLDKIKPYLKDVINDLKISDTWKIQLTIVINFISSKDNDEEHAMHSESDSMEIMINDEVDEVIEKLSKSLQKRYQIGSEELMSGSEFAFNYVHLLYYICHKINPNYIGSYVDSPDWIKNKIVTINPINKKIIDAFNTLQQSHNKN